MQRAVAAHGDSGDAAICAAWAGTVTRFDAGQEFLHQKILVADVAIARIDIERCVRIGRDNQKFSNLAALPQILHQIESSGVDEYLLVVAEAVEEIEDGVVARSVGVIAGRKNRT